MVTSASDLIRIVMKVVKTRHRSQSKINRKLANVVDFKLIQ